APGCQPPATLRTTMPGAVQPASPNTTGGLEDNSSESSSMASENTSLNGVPPATFVAPVAGLLETSAGGVVSGGPAGGALLQAASASKLSRTGSFLMRDFLPCPL